MRQVTVLLAALLLVSAYAHARPALPSNVRADVPADLDFSPGDRSEIKEYVNGRLPDQAAVDKVPGFIRTTVEDKVVEVHVTDADRHVCVNFNGVHVDEINNGPCSGEDVTVEATSNAVENVRDAEDPVEQIKKERNQGDITIRGHGVVNGLQIGVMNFSLSLASIVPF